eukprot:scaffold100421_cov36-Phaeocystis_antarctica.AAC.1
MAGWGFTFYCKFTNPGCTLYASSVACNVISGFCNRPKHPRGPTQRILYGFRGAKVDVRCF